MRQTGDPSPCNSSKRRSAALGSAMLGAWLGFHVPHTPLLGPMTAIIGAILAANLALIIFDTATAESAPTGEPGAAQANI